MKHVTYNKKNLGSGAEFTQHHFWRAKSGAGFTLLEVVIVVAILLIVATISIPSIVSLVNTPKVTNTSEEVVNMLKLAQNRTLSSDGNSQYGVYFQTTTTPHKYILFKGSSYASRTSSFDQAYSIPDTTEFYSINLGGGSEIVFNKITGTTQNAGDVSVRLKADHSQQKTVYVDSFGSIGFTAPITPSDTARAKDSRHVVVTYSRLINTSTENITLTFNGSTSVSIPINAYLINGQFEWEETVPVGLSNETIKIHTLRLNSSDTQFSIFRDMRFNSKSLTIGISGDSSGTLAEYTADGGTTTYHSIYISSFAWQ